jgi:SAM-dependent methyltransferase
MGYSGMRVLHRHDLAYAKPWITDTSGRVFFHDDRVLRAVYPRDAADLYRDLLKSEKLNQAFAEGLVHTRICEDLEVEGVPLLLEHHRVPFQTLPAEWTSLMHWMAAKMMVRVNIGLSQNGLMLKDSHPFNIMFYKGYPIFIDFGSLVSADRVNPHWLTEFRQYFAVPIWLASTRFRGFALEYRREKKVGFGLRLFDDRKVRFLLLRELEGISNLCTKPNIFFNQINEWLDRHKPKPPRDGRWTQYPQTHTGKSPLEPETAKQRFVYDILNRERPSRVLDCGCNKGYYSEMAARLGASVAAFDYEEAIVDECLHRAQAKELDVTPAMMDFSLPTPGYGAGLHGKSAFERLRVDVVLALGLIHHLCIGQQTPVELFCRITQTYAKRGVILQYVDPRDKHVILWNQKAADDYSVEAIHRYFHDSFPHVEVHGPITHEGTLRTYLYFHK